MADAPPKKGCPVEELVCGPPSITLECASSPPPTSTSGSVADQLAIAREALDAIDKITNTANLWLAIMSIAITVISLFSIGTIIFLLRGSAFKRADKGLEQFLDSDEFSNALSDKVAKAVDRDRTNTQGTGTEPGQTGDDTDLNEEEAFPDIP